ncbi:UDP-3-O-(3-hydroxymyristoyl)glucosamine N-acyltransferase [Membranihabitans marinus]|uniref:UDP-3-O-(3-hydroxymyristoyl)glucosamine N-acyltransferase n=1 Tax=Membranihabitans marinus TaxID=1227546 RepID=UPI001F0060C0|nr:UDP-3-O-(3-hydroxymyristoyl)glucosamine N-acyltransferase [Membranihabitans marinus]
MEVKIHQIAELIKAKVEGNADVVITHPAKIEHAGPGSITFFSNPRYEKYLYNTKASAVILDNDFILKEPVMATVLRVENVYLALSLLFEFLEKSKKVPQVVSDLAYVDPTAQVPSSCSVGPFTYIDKGTVLGENCRIGSHVHIGSNVVLGNDTVINSGVKIYRDCQIGESVIIHSNAVIGSDGFGFVKDDMGHYKKIPQIGNVIIGNDVEIGANTVIDRASMGSTEIKSGVKLDNLIQVGHNVVIGSHTVIAALTGVAGSVKIGEDNQIGGQVGIAGHTTIGSKNGIAGGTGIVKNVGDGELLMGYPAVKVKQFFKSHIYIQKLGEMERRIKQLEAKLNSDT